MKINAFFTETLGANLKNRRWSWGAVDPMTNRIFLRVWKDQIETMSDGDRIRVTTDKPRSHNHGFRERLSHLDQIQNGAEGFGIVCTAANSDAKEARKIMGFDRQTLLRLGTFIKENDHTYARIVARVPVDDVLRQRTAESTLTDDLKALVKQKIDSTTKETLVNARVGQGIFRSQVLKLWGHRCAVTHSETLDAIRASHIKPWRESTDRERLDPDNGFPLMANLDALFDAGLISFESSGKLIVSSMLNVTERQLFGIADKSLTKTPTAKTAEYLAYHRKHVFRK